MATMKEKKLQKKVANIFLKYFELFLKKDET